MAKFGKLPTKNYNIYHFNFSKLYEFGKVVDNVLEVNEEYSKKSYKIVKSNPLYEGYDLKGNCQLFDQTLKVLEQEDSVDIFEDIYVIIDFKDFINNGSKGVTFKKVLNRISQGIKLYIKDKQIHVVDFMKSNTMSKACCVMYINKELLETTNIKERITFDLDKGKYILSKWYAYSGLCVSDATILHNIKFNKDELVIIPDDEIERTVDCITAISVDLILELAKEYKDTIDHIKTLSMYSSSLTLNDALMIAKEKNSQYDDIKKFIPNIKVFEKIIKKLNCYKISKDYERISSSIEGSHYSNRSDIVTILDQVYEIICNNKPFSSVYESLGIMIALYNKKLQESHEVYWENFNVVDFPVTINKFDGCGLITLDLAKQINNELNAGNKKKLPFGYTFQIRMPFIKGIVNSCNIEEFCKEHNITKIYGKTYDKNQKLKEYDISKVKMILTESQFKCAKLMKNAGMTIDRFMELLNEFDYSLAINHLEYAHNNLVDLNYQVLSTIPFNQRELDYIIQFNDKEYKKETSSDKLVVSCLERYNSLLEQDILNYNPYYDFYMSTKRFKNYHKSTSKKLKNKYLELKFKQIGHRRFLCSDCLELIYHAFYHHTNNVFKSYMSLSEFYAPGNTFKPLEKCFILRNPHYSRNEIGIMKSSTQENNEREKYFGHLHGVLMFNPLSMLADRLGGADYDGDSVIVVSGMMAGKAMRALENKENGKGLKYPVINIPGLDSNNVEFNYANKVESLYNTFNSRVGLISNAAFGESFTLYKEDFSYHDRLALYTIINGLEIDSAKKGIKPMMLDGEKHEMAKEFLRIKDHELVGNKGLSNHSIKYIEEHANDHAIYYLMHNSLNYEPSPRTKTHRITNKCDYSQVEDSKLITMIETYVLYSKFDELVDKKRRYNIVFNDINGSDALYNKICDIITKNYPTYDTEQINELILNIRNGIEDIKDSLNKYCYEKENKFHYLTESYDKVNYIIHSLNINIDDDELEVLCNFKNDGYMLLYLVLNYLYNNNRSDNIKNNEDITTMVNYINKKVISKLNKHLCLNSDVVLKIANNVKKQYDKIVNRLKESSIAVIRDELYKDLTNKVKDISIDHFIAFERINESDIIFNVLHRQTKEYLITRLEDDYYE